MMMHIKKVIRQNLSKNSKASFVQSEFQENESFKYNLKLLTGKYVRDKLAKLRNPAVKLFQRFNLIFSEVDWKVLRNDLSGWTFQVLVEGSTANFATHFLFGVPLNPWTVIAHGIVINQGTNIYWRLRKDGTSTEIPKKDK